MADIVPVKLNDETLSPFGSMSGCLNMNVNSKPCPFVIADRLVNGIV
jgi:hypothetical protein